MVAPALPEVIEDISDSAIEYRNEALATLRELGPPDLVHLKKQSNKSSTKQIGSYHHVTGIDASSSASLAAYINTLTQSSSDRVSKIVSGTYWFESRLTIQVEESNVFSAATMLSLVWICGSK